MLITIIATMAFAYPASAIEEPDFRIVGTIKHPDGAIEIRRYAPMTVARTRISGDFARAGHRAFPRLGGYIFGANVREEKIKMTAPVSQAKDASGDWWVSFVMPRARTLDTLPRPRDTSVELVNLPARTMAVAKYRGGWSGKRYAAHEARLLEAVSSSQWRPEASPEWARYNPPMWPGFMKRNEIMVQVTPYATVVR